MITRTIVALPTKPITVIDRDETFVRILGMEQTIWLSRQHCLTCTECRLILSKHFNLGISKPFPLISAGMPTSTTNSAGTGS